MASSNPNNDDRIKYFTEQWTALNKQLEYVPKFQNKQQAGVSEERIKEVESKLKITIPKEIRTAIKVHDGRKHISYGLIHRLPTTDLLPISQWKPYEKEDDNFVEDLFQCLVDNNSVDKNLYEDTRDHLKVYKEIVEKSGKGTSDNKLTKNEAFQSLPCELLIIGQGMDDYAEQFLLSIRSGRIYLAIHNIPEWKLIGTFTDWMHTAMTDNKDQNDELEEIHDEVDVS